MYGYDILCGISKVPFEIPQNILPIHWKIWLLYNIEILRALRFKSSYAFLKRPLALHYSQEANDPPSKTDYDKNSSGKYNFICT